MGMRHFLQGLGGSRAQDIEAPPPPPAYALGVFLGPGVRLVGALRSDQDVVIQGRMEGPVSAKGQVVVEDGGHVEGDIAAATIRVLGRTHGALVAAEQVILEAGSEHHGIVRAPELAVEAGARVQGDVRVGPGPAEDDLRPGEAARDEPRLGTLV